jgi:hypothetical protein
MPPPFAEVGDGGISIVNVNGIAIGLILSDGNIQNANQQEEKH